MDKNEQANLSCAVVRDILPSYVEGLTSGETNAALESHLQGCTPCTEACGAMRAAAPEGIVPTGGHGPAEPEPGVAFLKKQKRKTGRLAIITAVLVFAAVVVGAYTLLYGVDHSVPRENIGYIITETADEVRFEIYLTGKYAQIGNVVLNGYYIDAAGEYVPLGELDGTENYLLDVRYRLGDLLFPQPSAGPHYGGEWEDTPDSRKYYDFTMTPDNVDAFYYRDGDTLKALWRAGEGAVLEM